MINISGFFEKADNLDQFIKLDNCIFISGISSEERCPRGWTILKEKGINVEKKIIFYFNEVINESQNDIFNNEAEKIFDDLFDIKSTDSKLFVDIYDEMMGLEEFKQVFENYEGAENKKIVLDMSVMVKPYIFILLKYLISIKKIKELYIMYTEPKSYHKSKLEMFSASNNHFTKGTINTGEIPSYSGNQDLDKRKALIILLGFEGERPLEVLNAINPDITIPVNGFPAYRPEFKDGSLILNDELLKEPDVFNNLMYAPANDPFETEKVLEEILSKHTNEYNMSIAPLGTKPMALGSCFFALEHPICRIIYPYPLKYNFKYSKGYGTTWVYLTTILSE